jgi:hypothetical protein
MNREARANGIEATFFGTPRGALIIEDIPGAAMLTVSTRSAWEVDRHCWSHRERQPRSLTEHSSRDPMVVEMADAAVIENTKGACEPDMLGGSIIQREEQKRRKEDCASIVFKLNGLLSGPERKVWISMVFMPIKKPAKPLGS